MCARSVSEESMCVGPVTATASLTHPPTTTSFTSDPLLTHPLHWVSCQIPIMDFEILEHILIGNYRSGKALLYRLWYKWHGREWTQEIWATTMPNTLRPETLDRHMRGDANSPFFLSGPSVPSFKCLISHFINIFFWVDLIVLYIK